MSNEKKYLPVIDQAPEETDAPSCSPKIYVSNEEAAILTAMRELRGDSLKLKRDIESADGDKRSRLEAELEDLRAQWKELSARRERAFIQKMIMLGHLPSDYPLGR